MGTEVTSLIAKDIEIAKAKLADLPLDWDGKNCVLELNDADYNWRPRPPKYMIDLERIDHFHSESLEFRQ